MHRRRVPSMRRASAVAAASQAAPVAAAKSRGARRRAMRSLPRGFLSSSVAGLLLLAALGLAACAKKADHTSFASPDEAATALIAAARTGDQGKIRQLFGPGSEDIVSSGDDVADASSRENFVAMYDVKHELVPE